MKKIIALMLVFMLIFAGCGAGKEEPGNSYPIMMQYNGTMYFHRGIVRYEMPEELEFLGEIKKVDTLEIAEDFEGNEEGFLYENSENGEIWFRYKEWDEIKDGGKEPFVILVPEELAEQEEPEKEPAPVPEEQPVAEEEKEEDSDMKKINGGFSIISGPSDSEKDAVALENTYVLRANGMGNGAEETMWSRYAANEKNSKTDKPIMFFDSAEKLKSFYVDMEGTYQFGSGKDSAKEKILSYDKDYFEENALIIIHIRSGSGSVRYTVTDVDISGETCNITVNAKMPEVGTADMADWFVIIEQPKTEIENCGTFKLKIN